MILDLSSVGLLSEEETEGNSLSKRLPDWSVAGVLHVLLADVTSHVGPICLPALWKHVSVSEAGVICHA